MISHPTAAELARAVSQWIDQVRPQLDSRNAYLARVAMGALSVVDRELCQRDAAKAGSTVQLAKLLGKPEGDADYDSLTRELCRRLREGNMTIDTPGLLSTLRADTQAKLAIDQPGYRQDVVVGTSDKT